MDRILGAKTKVFHWFYNKIEKPFMSYAQLIAEALNNAPEQSLVLSDIYKAINAKHPYYKLEAQGWQKGISTRLTLNKYFIKIKGKLVGESGCRERVGQSGFLLGDWTILAKTILAKSPLNSSIIQQEY